MKTVSRPVRILCVDSQLSIEPVISYKPLPRVSTWKRCTRFNTLLSYAG